VSVDSTTLLTERFFAHLKEGKGSLDALRLARSDVRKAGYEHPYYWAPFILVGEN
jgi:CHAT domain-containing protein